MPVKAKTFLQTGLLITFPAFALPLIFDEEDF
jgi:hypothetical protein